jgi:hypothetical protein
MSTLSIKQSAFSAVFRLTLEPSDIVYSHSEVFSTKKTIPYRQVTGVFRDAERAYIVWSGQVAKFLHQAGNQDYELFMAELLKRINASRGA